MLLINIELLVLVIIAIGGLVMLNSHNNELRAGYNDLKKDLKEINELIKYFNK